MVMVMSVVPMSVVKELNASGEIYSTNRNSKHNFNYEPYAILEDLSGMSNFFFGAVNCEINDTSLYSLDSTRYENTELLVMDIPEEELFFTNFSRFESYIDSYHKAVCCEDICRIKSLYDFWVNDLEVSHEDGFCQGTFSHIKKEWVVYTSTRAEIMDNPHEKAKVNEVIKSHAA